MPVAFALPIGLLIGLSLAWLARVELARSEVPLVLARPFLVALGYGAIIHGPVTAYFLAMHADWAYLYLVRPWLVPSAVDLALVLACAAQIPLGFALATPWAIAKRGPALLKLGALIGALVLVGCVVAARRLSVSASYMQYHGGFGVVPLGKTSLGRGILLSWVALLAGYGWSARVLLARRS
jgi:hypothetical protein